MTNDIINQIIGVFSRFITDDGELDAIRRGEPILESTSIDSLTIVHLVAELEGEFRTRFTLDEIEQNFENINTLASSLRREGE